MRAGLLLLTMLALTAPASGETLVTNGQTLVFPNPEQRDRFVRETRGQKTVFSTPKPDYPREARRQMLRGRCIVRMKFYRPGLPAQVDIAQSSGWKLLDKETREWAEHHWRLVRHEGAWPVIKDVPVNYVAAR